MRTRASSPPSARASARTSASSVVLDVDASLVRVVDRDIQRARVRTRVDDASRNDASLGVRHTSTRVAGSTRARAVARARSIDRARVPIARMELVDFETQVAGNHAHGLTTKRSPCGTWFYKPELASDARGTNERAFYDAYVDRAWDGGASVEGGAATPRSALERAFVNARVPRCPTAVTGANDDALDVEGYLRLNNLTHGYERACVIDLKIGTRTWDPAHSKEYVEKRKASDEGTTLATLGFKVCGARYFDANGELVKISRARCKEIRSSEELTRGLLEDFVRDPASGEANNWFWPALLRQLLSEPLRLLKHRLVGTSLLVVYESGRLAPASDSAVCVPEAKLEARYIDFCHSVLKESIDEVDENFEAGLKLFQRFVEENR